MYNNNFKKWMNKLVNIQRDILVMPKENGAYANDYENDSPKKNLKEALDVH